jgi:hypothetical protein
MDRPQRRPSSFWCFPDDVRGFALHECEFVAAGEDEGAYFVQPAPYSDGPDDDPRWLVILDPRWKIDEIQGVIAARLALTRPFTGTETVPLEDSP